MITANLRNIKDDIKHYDAELIAVSKKQPDDRIEEALMCGLRVFGENRVQEAEARWGDRRALYPDLKLHLIGPLQTNKVKAACALFDVIQTLDREKLAREIIKHAPDMPCFIQVNTGDESQKAGISVNELQDFHDFCRDLKMNILGLMCIPPIDEPAGLHFGLLAQNAKQLGLKHLSMGMSNDYPLALQYGATHIRVGSKIFGERES
jgi:pyridoxal phosphate enzyme (YggS family)